MLRFLIPIACLLSTGCSMLPEIAHQPTLHNPFPQITKVAVAPFFNLSHEPTIDGSRVAVAYFNELQLVPGFEVLPVGVVERAIVDHRIVLRGPEDARRLAQALNVDAVVLGAITDYSPYYPPRIGLQVEWYAANPCFHPIPPGYGLPWGTPLEQDIPGPLVFEAEMALAKAQLKTQTPAYEKLAEPPPGASGNGLEPIPISPNGQNGPGGPNPGGAPNTPNNPSIPTGPAGVRQQNGVQPVNHQIEMEQGGPPPVMNRVAPCDPPGMAGMPGVGMPPDWPDPRGFIPPPPSCRPPTCCPTSAPVLRHTRTYNGHDGEFTEALASYYYFRDDARFGGWQGYLQRSDDFIRFCCHMHISEMLSARGGAGETRVVWRWPTIR